MKQTNQPHGVTTDLSNDIFIVPISNNYLLYSPLKHISALVNDKAIQLILEQFPPGDDSIMEGLWRELVSAPSPPPAQRSGEVHPAFLGIITTRRCNLACAYCGFGASSATAGRMDYKIAVAAVDWMAERMVALGRDTLEIHFFGGEPFVAGEVIDVTIHRARAVADKLGLVPYFEVATNGVFNKERARFVGDYFDTVVLSFDGPEHIHNRHRPVNSERGSFEEVARTAHILSRSPTELCFRCCVSSENVTMMVEISQWFYETFSPAIINFETLKPTAESETAGLTSPDPYDFAVNFMQARRLLDRCGIQAIYAAAETGMVRHSFCPAGKDTVIVSPDGRVSNCYLPQKEWQARGLDMNFGRIKFDGTMHIAQNTIEGLRLLVTDKPLCENCFCQWSCAGGCHVSHSFPGCSVAYNDFCIQTRIITACTILEDLGLGQEVDQLLSDRRSMEKLALHNSDRLEDW